MIRKRAIAVAAGSILMVAAISALALARGGGPSRGGHEMWLLARAAGLNHSQIASAFQNDTNLPTDRATLKSTHDAMMTCLFSSTVSATGCSTQITSFSSALQTMAQERMTVWQNLLKTAPNLSQAVSVYSQLQNLRAQKKQVLQSVFGSPTNQAGPASSTDSSSE